MATKVVMEALSPTMEEGRLVKWNKNEGDAVKNGDVLAEVETDKAVMDLVARAGGVLLKQVIAPGTITTFLEPLYKGGLEGVTPGSSCVVNAYTSNHELIASKDTGGFKRFVLHAVDAVGVVHAMLLRIQALLLPIKTLVLSGH